MRGLMVFVIALFASVGLPDTVVANDTPKPAEAAQSGAPAGGSEAAPACDMDVAQGRVNNLGLTILADQQTAWQPRGGTVNFTVTGKTSLPDGLRLLVCFGWTGRDAAATGQSFHEAPGVTLVKYDTRSASFSVGVPGDLASAPPDLLDYAGLGLVPMATMRIFAYGDKITPFVVVQPRIGITTPVLAAILAVLAVLTCLGFVRAFGKDRGVPGEGLALWMISTRNGVASLSQAQVILWTAVIGASAVYVMALSGVLIDITNGMLVLLGIAGAATVGSKLQNSQQDTKAGGKPDGAMAKPGPVLSPQKIGEASDSDARIGWTAPVTGGPVARYVVQFVNAADIKPGADGKPVPVVWSTVGETILKPHHTILGLQAGAEYNVRVAAANAGGTGDWAELNGIRTAPKQNLAQGVPGRVPGLRIEGAVELTKIPLAWSAADNAPAGYVVQKRRHDSEDAWSPCGFPGEDLSVTVDSLASGETYDFRVAAVNAAGTGPWSYVIWARTVRKPQWADLVVTGDPQGEIDVTRVQMLFFTLVAAGFVGMKVLNSYKIPDIPDGILLLMGISNGVYITAKFIPD
jgi:hypothetical protein